MGKESKRSRNYRDDRDEREEEKFLKKIELDNEKLPQGYAEILKEREEYMKMKASPLPVEWDDEEEEWICDEDYMQDVDKK